MEPWVIRKSGYFYRPNRCGYTQEVSAAGHYTEAEAKAEASVEPHSMSAHPLRDFLKNCDLPDLALDIEVLQVTEILTRSTLDIETGERLFDGVRVDLHIEDIDRALALLARLAERSKSFQYSRR